MRARTFVCWRCFCLPSTWNEGWHTPCSQHDVLDEWRRHAGASGKESTAFSQLPPSLQWCRDVSPEQPQPSCQWDSSQLQAEADIRKSRVEKGKKPKPRRFRPWSPTCLQTSQLYEPINALCLKPFWVGFSLISDWKHSHWLSAFWNLKTWF